MSTFMLLARMFFLRENARLVLPAWLNSYVTAIPQQQKMVNSCFFSFLQFYISCKNPANKISKRFSQTPIITKLLNFKVLLIVNFGKNWIERFLFHILFSISKPM